MSGSWRRPRIDPMVALKALADAPRPATTSCVFEKAPARHSRHQVYRALTKLETEGLVDKEIVSGATSIAHAYWTITDKGWTALTPTNSNQGEGERHG